MDARIAYANWLNASLTETQVSEAIVGSINVCSPNGQGRGSDCKLGTNSRVTQKT